MSVTAISPIDGRYEAQTADLTDDFSEYALIRSRVRVEVEWLLFLAEQPGITDVRRFTDEEQAYLRGLASDFAPAQAERVKAIEQTTRHDVKAVEYYLGEKLAGTSLADAVPFIHFCCTSEDINNLAYGLMLQNGITQQVAPPGGADGGPRGDAGGGDAGRRHAGPHARAAGQPDDAGQRVGRLRPSLAAAIGASRRHRILRQVQRHGGQLPHPHHRLPRSALGRPVPAVRVACWV